MVGASRNSTDHQTLISTVDWSESMTNFSTVGIGTIAYEIALYLIFGSLCAMRWTDEIIIVQWNLCNSTSEIFVIL
jgi:hypothetical protein